MDAELLIRFVLIVGLWRISGFSHRRDDGVGFSLKNKVSVHRLCIRALRARENKRQFYAISLQKQAIIEDIQ